MKRFCFLCMTVLLCAAFLTGCLGIASQIVEEIVKPAPMMVSVMLQQAEGMTIKGDNPRMVEVGTNASFEVEIAPG